MRKSDKLKNFKKVNLLTEQRYLQSKGVISESVYNADDNQFSNLNGIADFGESTKSIAFRRVLDAFNKIKNGAKPNEVGVGLALSQFKDEASEEEYQKISDEYRNIVTTHGLHIGMDESVLGVSGAEIDIDGITDSLVATTLHGGDDNTVYLRAKDSLVDSDEQVKGEFYNMLADKMEANNLTNQAQQYRSIAQQYQGGLQEELDEYDYRSFDQNYGTLEKDRKEKINQFGKDRQARDGIKMKSLTMDISGFLSPRLSNDIYCRSFETHTISNLDDVLSFAAKLYTQQINNGNKPFYIEKDDETYKFFLHNQAYDIFDVVNKGGGAFIKGYKQDITHVELEFNLRNTLINFNTNRGDTRQETKDIKLVTIGTLVKNNDKINPPFTYKINGIKLELGLIPSSPQDAIKLISIIKETIKNEYKFELNKLFISDVIIEKQAFSKGNFGYKL